LAVGELEARLHQIVGIVDVNLSEEGGGESVGYDAQILILVHLNIAVLALGVDGCLIVVALAAPGLYPYAQKLFVVYIQLEQLILGLIG
jgi:hypothetical protein